MYLFFKRFFDVVFSFIALLLLLPVFVIIIILLSFTGEKEVFYLQSRIGLNNKSFKIWKFATMLKNSPSIGTGTLTLRNDPRVTKLGKYLRITKINELPQIVNILKGDMSIVGPRPLMPKDVERYPEEIRNKIYNVKPGLTGIGSIVFRDEEFLVSNTKEDPIFFYKKIIMPYKGTLEIWYQSNNNMLLDFKIIFLTAWLVLFPHSKLINKVFKDLPERNF